MENELDTPQSENVEEQEVAVEPQEEVEETNEELEKAKSAFNDQKIRAEKAEKELKALKAEKPKVKEVAPKKTSEGLTNEDVFSLIEAKVPKADIPAIKDAAKALGLSVSESLASPVVKAILKTNADERQTAEATNTGKGKRGVSNISDEAIVQAVADGKDVDAAKYAEAQMALRKKKVQ